VSPKCSLNSQGRRQSPLPAGHREKERRFGAKPCFPRLPGWHAACQHDARPNSLQFLGQHPLLVMPPSPPTARAAQQPLCMGWEHPRGSTPHVPMPPSLTGPIHNPWIFRAYAHVSASWAIPQMHLRTLTLPLLAAAPMGELGPPGAEPTACPCLHLFFGVA